MTYLDVSVHCLIPSFALLIGGIVGSRIIDLADELYVRSF
jgi:hypothetical protein